MGLTVSPADIQEFGPITLQGLITSLTIARGICSFIYACVTIMFWDMLLTIPVEVELLWKSGLSLLKVIFLFNRYVSAMVIAVSVFLMSGLSSGLTDSTCRGWLAFSTFLEILSIASTSFLYAFRLWAWYEMSTRTLTILILVWALSLLVSIGLLIDTAGVHNRDFVYQPIFNVCVSLKKVIWPQWVPATVEHGVYASFLLFNAMRTPRSERTPALAILYRDGILFYMVTFVVCAGSLGLLVLGPRVYVPLGTYPPWIIFQVAISRFLLNVKTSQLFASKEQSSGPKQTSNPGLPLRDMATQENVKRTSYIVVKQRGTASVSAKKEDDGEQAEHRSQVSDVNHIDRGDEPDDVESRPAVGNKRSYVGKEMRQIQSNHGRLRRQFWWLFRRNDFVDIHVDVMQVENEGDDWRDVGGVKESRLGRLDAYF